MKFSPNSTKIVVISNNPPPRQIEEKGVDTDDLQRNLNNLQLFNYYCGQLIDVNEDLNQLLLTNNQLIQQRQSISLAKPNEPQKRLFNQSNPSTSIKNSSDDNQKEKSQSEKVPKQARFKKMKKQQSCDEQYIPEEDSRKEEVVSKSSQSKNIPKNYSKAILQFIRKNDHYRTKVLKHLDIDEQQFTYSLEFYRGGLSSIRQLQQLWQGEDKISKAYRIMSMEYLRKHCLWHIFNSRVNIYGKHIKYRYRIIESVSDPKNFTSMKEF